jgi:hypothetical protein
LRNDFFFFSSVVILIIILSYEKRISIEIGEQIFESYLKQNKNTVFKMTFKLHIIKFRFKISFKILNKLCWLCLFKVLYQMKF